MKHLTFLSAALLVFSVLFGPLAPAAPAVQAAAPVPSEESGWVLVSTADELAYINQNQPPYMNRNIRLTNDIDMTGYEWIPLGGNEAEAFSGIFDGRGHRIDGITIDGGTLQFVGFFGSITGTVRDLSISVQVEGGIYTGGLAGTLNGGSVIRSCTVGAVTGGDGDAFGVSSVGGIAGTAIGNSTISRSSSSAAVKSGAVGNQYAGGLVGAQGLGLISDSYATGTVSNSDGYYYRGGGLTGQLIYGTIESSYAAGAVTAPANSPYKLMGGFVGSIEFEGSIVASYFDNVAALLTNGAGYHSGGDAVQLTGRATADMKLASNYGEQEKDWDFEEIWAVHPSVNAGYPYLRPFVLTSGLPRAFKEAPYSLTLEAFDGAGGGLNWSGSGLPAGLHLTASGVLEGIPSESGAFTVTVTATDAGLKAASAVMMLDIDEAAPDIVNLVIGPGGVFGSTKIAAAPGSPDHVFAYLLGDGAVARPLSGTLLPDEAIIYSPGSDIFPVSGGQILQVYEANESSRIVAWSSVQIEALHIQDQIRVTGVSLNATELTLMAGQPPKKLTAAIEPANATNRTVFWSSSNPAAVEVDQTGEVTPIAEGTAVITVTTGDGALTAQATVTVQPIPPTVGSVTGAVYGAGNAPLAGAAVSAGGIAGSTDGEGSFTLTNIAEGVHTLSVSARGYLAYSAEVNAIAGKTVDAGRIGLKVEHTSEPSNGSNGPNGPQGSPQVTEPNEMTVKINGIDVRVHAIKERENDGRSVIRLIVKDDLLRSLFAAGEKAVIDIDNEDPVVKVDFPAETLQALSKARPNAVIRIGVNGASYSLPLRIWDSIPKDATVTAAIAKITPADKNKLDDTLTRQGYAMLGEPVDFSLYSDGVEWEEAEGVYTERTLSLNTAAKSDRSTVVWVDAAGRLHFVPSVFEKEKAIFYATHNSLFTAIESGRTFADITIHWARADIELLANKLVIDGTTQNSFEPDRSVTRAEFAAMLVRALGLVEQPGRIAYSDVRAEEDWYAGAVEAASEAGLIEGYEDGTFRPNALVTREQTVVMLVRAIRYAGELPMADIIALERFSDHALTAGWARESAAQLLTAGIIEGVDAAKLAPKELATRAQSAVLLTRMLRYLKFIN